MIEVNGISAARARGFLGTMVTVLDNVSFSVADGHVCGLVGANGAGKSTTIRHIVGIAVPKSGSISLGGAAPTLLATRKKLGYAPELPSLPPTLTPMELLELHSALMGATPDPALLERVGLEGRARDPIRTFSKGMVQRLTLALALIGAPAVLILDEPMSGLDPIGRELVRRLIREEKARGTTILLSSHVLSDVTRLCDQVVVIRAGRIVLDSKIEAEAVTQYDVVSDGVSTRVALSALSDTLAEAHRNGREVTQVEPVRSTLEERVLSVLETQ